MCCLCLQLWLIQGQIQDFLKGGVETRDTKCGGCPLQVRHEKRGGGGGAVRLRPDTKSGGGGGVAVNLRRKAERGAVRRFRPDTKSGGGGGGGGCLAEEGEVPYMKGGCNPQNPPLDPPLLITLIDGHNI